MCMTEAEKDAAGIVRGPRVSESVQPHHRRLSALRCWRVGRLSGSRHRRSECRRAQSLDDMQGVGSSSHNRAVSRPVSPVTQAVSSQANVFIVAGDGSDVVAMKAHPRHRTIVSRLQRSKVGIFFATRTQRRSMIQRRSGKRR